MIELVSIVPKTFRLLFPKSTIGPEPPEKDDHYTVKTISVSDTFSDLSMTPPASPYDDLSLFGFDIPTITSAPLTIKDTLNAILQTSTSTPENNTALINVANLIAYDLAPFLIEHYDTTYFGMIDLFSCALDDEIVWTYREDECTTRVFSSTYLEFPKNLYHQDTPCDTEYIRLTGDPDANARYPWEGVYHATPNSWSTNTLVGLTTNDDLACEGNGDDGAEVGLVYPAHRARQSRKMVFFAGTALSSGGSKDRDRCVCTESVYEINKECGNCHGYATYDPCTDTVTNHAPVLPLIFVVKISSSVSNPAHATCADCADWVGDEIEIRNVLDSYDQPTCTWKGTGKKHCQSLEMTIGSTNTVLSIIGKSGSCADAVLSMLSKSFKCCDKNNPNTAWTGDDADRCVLSISVKPHECTCCPDGQKQKRVNIGCNTCDSTVPSSLTFNDGIGNVSCPLVETIYSAGVPVGARYKGSYTRTATSVEQPNDPFCGSYKFVGPSRQCSNDSDLGIYDTCQIETVDLGVEITYTCGDDLGAQPSLEFRVYALHSCSGGYDVQGTEVKMFDSEAASGQSTIFQTPDPSIPLYGKACGPPISASWTTSIDPILSYLSGIDLAIYVYFNCPSQLIYAAFGCHAQTPGTSITFTVSE